MTVFDDKKEKEGNKPLEEKKEKVIVLDGPLSAIYTRALLEAYPHDKLTKESQQMDTVNAAAIAVVDSEEKLKALREKKDLSYNYVTSVSRLNDLSHVGNAVNSIEKARASGLYKDFSTIIELDSPINDKTGLLVNYSHENGMDLYFPEKRNLSLESFIGRINKCKHSKAVLKIT